MVSTSCQKPTNIQIGELHNSKLSILFHVNKLMEQESMSKRLMRNDHISESDCSHHPEIRQVPKTQLPKFRVKIGVLHTIVLEHDQSSFIEDGKDEESCHGQTLLRC